MFSMLRAVFTLLICLLLVGLYLGWFSLKRAPSDPNSNTVNVNVSVDKQKVGADLRTLEQNVAKRIQDMNGQPPNNAPPTQGQRTAAPGLNIGPINIQPSEPNGQSTNGRLGGQPEIRLESQGYQLSVPINTAPQGEGR